MSSTSDFDPKKLIAALLSQGIAPEVVAKQLGVGKESVRRWVIQSQVDSGQRAGASSEELAEIKALKAENRRLREDVEILRGATTFFVSMPS